MKILASVLLTLLLLSIWNDCFIGAMDEIETENEDSMEAKIALYKHTETNPIVEGKDFIITYQLINVGNGVATGIEIRDRYDPNSFETISNVDSEGIVSLEVDELAPGSSTSYNVTVRPKLYGMYESTRARIKYNNGLLLTSEELEPEVKHGYSTSLGRVRIISKAEDDRNNNYFVREWLTFLILYGLPTMIPYVLWQKARSEHPNDRKKR